MRQIPILSDQFSTRELEALIQAEIGNDSAFSLEIIEEKPGYKDTAILAAWITGNLALTGVAITQIVTILLKIFEKRQDRKNTKIVIKGNSGRSIEFPADASQEEIERYIALAKQLDAEAEAGIKYIATV